MRVLIQRVTEASVRVEGQVVGECGKGLLILVCAMQGDDMATAQKMAGRVARLRIFRDDQDRMNRSLLDVGGQALVVSQFTLAADMRSGNRPGFSTAAPPEHANALVTGFVQTLREQGLAVQTGLFGAAMQVALVNDGPVTIWMDSAGRP